MNRYIAVVGIAGAAVLGYAHFVNTQRAEDLGPIASFEECVQAGNPVLDSYPEQCETPNGDRFSAFEMPENWQVHTADEAGTVFMYPEDLGLTYVEAHDWPPEMQLMDAPAECLDAGDITDRDGRTELRSIDGRDYCVTTIVEGAAGSVYTQYAYTTDVDDRAVALTFITRATQCANLETDSEKEECESDQHVNLDIIIDQMMRTLRLGN